MPAYGTTVVTPASYATNPDISLDFDPDTWFFRSDSGDYKVSFDGVQDHLLIKAADTFPTVLSLRRRKAWFKQSGGASTARVGVFSKS